MQKMKEDMKAQDDQITEQFTEMNQAPQDRKLYLMAAILPNIVEKRITMDARKAKMDEEMMQHVQMGKESMSQRPMMKGMTRTRTKHRRAPTQRASRRTEMIAERYHAPRRTVAAAQWWLLQMALLPPLTVRIAGW